MAYGLKYFFVDKKIVTTTEYTYRWELYEDGYVGSSTEWTGINIQRNYDQSSLRKINYIQKSSCTGNIRIEDQAQRTIIEGIADSQIGDWKVVLKRDGSVIWTGLLVPDLITISEENFRNQSASIVAKDLDIVGDYTLTTGRDSAIEIIAGILNILGYEIDIVSYTCWTETNELTSTDDILEQTYHEKGRFRRFGRTDDESDRPISNLEVLKWMLTTYGLVLRQANGVWNLIQISAFNTPTSVRRFVYDYTGTFQSKNLTYSLGSTSANSGDLRLFGSSSNTYFAGLKRIDSKLQHDSIYQGIKFNREYWFPNTNALTRSQNWEADGTGNLTLEFTTWLGRNTSGSTDLGGNTVIGDVTIQCGTFYFDGSEWTTTGTPTIEISVEDVHSTLDGSGNYVHKNQGLTIVTDPIPSGASGVLTVTIQPRGAIPQFEYMYIRDLNFNLQYSDTVEGSSTSIEYILESDLNYSEEYNFGTYYFGSGLPLSSLASLTDGANDILANFKRTYDASTTSHAELLLREVLDIRRTQKRSIRSVLYGEYEPDDIISYDSTNFFFFGGSWDSKTYQWSANLGEFNVQRPSDVSALADTFTAIYLTNGEGGYSGSVSGSTTSSNVPSSEFLRKANNLSDLTNDATARQNLGVEIGVDVQGYDADLSAIAGLSNANGNIIVGNGSTWVAESGNTARTSIGLGNTNNVTHNTLTLGDTGSSLGSLTIEDNVVPDTGNLTLETDPDKAGSARFTMDRSLEVNDTLYADRVYTDEVEAGTDIKTPQITPPDPTTLVWSTTTQVWSTSTSTWTNNLISILSTVEISESLDVTQNLNVAQNTDLDGTLNVQGEITTQAGIEHDSFVSGFTGQNYDINTDGSAEFQNLLVRGNLRVFEFIAKQISTVGGTEILSIAQGRIKEVLIGSDEVVIDNVGGSTSTSFQAQDLWLIQTVDINTGTVTRVHGSVASVSGDTVELSFTLGDITQIKEGQLMVVYGSLTANTRSNIMYRNVDTTLDRNISRFQIQVDSFADLTSRLNTRVAIGDIREYIPTTFENYGFYAGEFVGKHVIITNDGIQINNGSTTLAEHTGTSFRVGDSNNFVNFNGSSGSLSIKTDVFDLESGDLAIKSTGTTYPSASQNSITSYTSGNFTFAQYQQFRTIQSNKYYKYQFEYDLQYLGNFQADFNVEFMERNSGIVTPLSAFTSIIYFQNQQYFDSTSTSGATLTITDISTSFDTKFKIQSPSASDSTYQGRITLYIQILDDASVDEIGLRFTNTHSLGTSVDCVLPELDFVEYNPATELNPSGTFTRLADSIIIANGREYQNRTLIVNE